jgi:hypothetical protein
MSPEPLRSASAGSDSEDAFPSAEEQPESARADTADTAVRLASRTRVETLLEGGRRIMGMVFPSRSLALRAFFGRALNLGGAAGILEGEGPSPILPVEGGPPPGLCPEDLQKNLLLPITIPIH